MTVERKSADRQADIGRSPTVDDRYLVVDGSGRIRRELDTGHPRAWDAIILMDRIGQADMAHALRLVRDPAIPVADFGGNRHIRSDFSAAIPDAPTIAAMEAVFAPIRSRLATLPTDMVVNNRESLLTLRLAFTRDVPIKAQYAAETRDWVEYPLLRGLQGVRRRLEEMTALGLLERRHFARTNICRNCASARLHAYEACPNCGGSDLTDEMLVHHYRCGCQEPESRFTHGTQLICPKCQRELTHFGVDYGKPGVIVECRSCGASNSEPFPRFACLDCGQVMDTEEAGHADWYDYTLTDQALEALRAGHLPRTDEALSADSDRSRSRKEFLLLAEEGLRVAKRFDRPFSIGAIAVANAETVRQAMGGDLIDDTVRRIAGAVAAELSESEFLTPAAEAGILVAMPETTAADGETIIARLQETASAAVTVDLTSTVQEGDAAAELLKIC